jgi:hypothetical protein
MLVREVGGSATHLATDGSSLHELAAFVGVDLTEPFDCGKDTPEVGDVGAPLTVDRDAVGVLADWFTSGWTLLDRAVSELPGVLEPAVVQLWPEHFDAGTNVALASSPGQRVNLGVSPGDQYEDQPYLYVGPWGFVPRANDAYWNAPFGATLRWTDLAATADPHAAGHEFFRTGLHLAGDQGPRSS